MVHLPEPHHEFQSFCQCLSRLWGEQPHKAACRHTGVTQVCSGLWPPTSDLLHPICTACVQPFHHLDSHPWSKHMKNHMLTTCHPGRERAGGREWALKPQAWKKGTATQLPTSNNQGQRVHLDLHYRPWLLRVVFSLDALEERQRSEPGEFLTRGKDTLNCAGSRLGIQTSWAPAVPTSSVALGKSITPFRPHSQSANWELTTWS